MYAVILWIYFAIFVNTNGKINYTWLEFNDRFDCVAGISVNNTPVGVGVFVSTQTLITAANPFNANINTPSTANQIKIHTISKAYNNSKVRGVSNLAGNQAFRKKAWVNIGYDDKSHTTIHDILLINVDKKILRRPEKALREQNDTRRPFPVDLTFANNSLDNGDGWVIAGFGYVDENHVRDNIDLEVSYLEEEAITDCDEWIPREWGRFICLKNEDDLVGVASGSPLFNNRYMNTIIGIGSFALTKGKESILVFTDLRPYVDNLYGFLEDPPKNKTKTQNSTYF